MSVDLTKFDIYNYDLILRPNNQSITKDIHNALTAIGSGLLKKQFMNIPNGFVFNPNHKAYLYLKDLRISIRDAIEIVILDYQKRKFYLKVVTASQYNFSNFTSLDQVRVGDTQVLDTRPTSALIPLEFKEIMRDLDNIPPNSRMREFADKTLKSQMTGVVRVKDTINIIDTGKGASVDTSTDTELFHNGVAGESYVEIPAQIEYVPADPAQPGNLAKTQIKRFGNGKMLMGLSLDKDTNILDRMVCIGNPFGNEIEFQICEVNPTTNYPTLVGDATNQTNYNTSLNNLLMSGAITLSFSILITKGDKDY